MSNLVVGLATADIHLSSRPPIARSAEPDWYAAMARPLKQLRALQDQYKCPIFVAGDIFHTAKVPPELLNFALDHLPTCYAVAGNHDLPHHSLDDIHKSAYWTLAKVGKIIHLPTDRALEVTLGTPIRVRGFSWGQELQPCRYPYDMILELALVHRYVWTRATGYEGAPTSNRLKAFLPKLAGYDVACFGDNHKPFYHPTKDDKLHVVNCGSLMRRNVDQIDYNPSVWLLHENGCASPYPLDCSEDKFLDATELAAELGGAGLEDFIAELSSLGDSAVNFKEAVKQYLDRENVGEGVRRAIISALGGEGL